MNVLISYPSFYFTDKEYDAGGEQRYAWETVYRLAQRGVDCYVVGPEIDLTRSYERIKTFQIKNSAFRNINNLFLRRLVIIDFHIRSRRLCKRIIKEYDIDIIHHIRPSYPGFFSSVADLPLPFIYGGVTTKYTPLIENPSYKEKKWYEKLKMKKWKRTLQNTSVILLECSAAKEEIPPELWDRTELVHMGVDTDFFTSAYPPPNKVKTVLYVGSVRRNKGSDVLLKAIPEVKRSYPNVQFILAGRIFEHDYFLGLVQELGIEQSVKLVGAISHKDTLNYFHEADIFCLPSIQESISMVILEALSCGLPVVASNVMGIPDVIQTGTNGLLVEAGNVSSLSKAILRLLNNEKMCLDFSRNNRRQAEERFAWDRHIDKLVQIYNEVLKSPKPKKKNS